MFDFDVFDKLDDLNLKVAIIGDTNKVLNEYAADLGVTVLTNSLADPASWKGTDVCFLVANTIKANVLENFQRVIEIVKQQDIMAIPVLITDDEYFVADNVADLAMVLNQHWFDDADALYTYIGECIASMQSILSQATLVNIDIDDIKAAWGNSGRIIFSYGEYKAGTDEHQAIAAVKQKLRNMNFSIGSEKSIVFTLSGNVANETMDIPFKFNGMIVDEFGIDDCPVIFQVTNTANTDMTDKIRLSMWLKY